MGECTQTFWIRVGGAVGRVPSEVSSDVQLVVCMAECVGGQHVSSM